MDIPSDLLYFTSQISNYSKNTVKLQTLAQSTLSSNGATQMRVSLPVNAIVNMKSLSLHCNFQTNGVAATGGNANRVFALIPKGGISAVTDRLSFTMGGVAVDSGMSSYNVVKLMKESNEKTINKYMSDSKVLEASIIDPWEAGNSDHGDANAGQARDLVQNNWLGFTECEPCFLDMSLVPECFVTLQIAPASVLPIQYEGTALGVNTPAVANANFTGSQCSYSLANCYWTCQVVTVGNGLYQHFRKNSLKTVEALMSPIANIRTLRLISVVLVVLSVEVVLQ